MRAATKLLAPAFDELSLVVEHHHTVRLLARRINGVMYINVTLRVFTDAMRVAVLNINRKLAPIVSDLVGMFSRAQNRLPAAGFIRGAKNQRRDKASSNLSEKLATGYRHACIPQRFGEAD